MKKAPPKRPPNLPRVSPWQRLDRAGMPARTHGASSVGVEGCGKCAKKDVWRVVVLETLDIKGF